MGTHASIVIKEHGIPIVNIYTQYDGYPEEMGMTLYKLLKDSMLVNGYSGNMSKPNYHNGMGCLAATVVEKLKNNTIGNIYLQPLHQMYEIDHYEIYNKDGSIYMKYFCGHDLKFDDMIKFFDRYMHDPDDWSLISDVTRFVRGLIKVPEKQMDMHLYLSPYTEYKDIIMNWIKSEDEEDYLIHTLITKIKEKNNGNN